MQRFTPIGLDEIDNLGDKSGTEFIVMALSQMVVHKHDKGTLDIEAVDGHSHSIQPGDFGNTGRGVASDQFYNNAPNEYYGPSARTSADGEHDHNIVNTSAFTGDGDSIGIMQPALVARWGIRNS